MDKMLALLQNNASSIGHLKNQISAIQSYLSESSKDCLERINLLKSKLESEPLAINDQMDGAFGYVDNRMDLIFTDKSIPINSQFLEAEEATQAKIIHHVSELCRETGTLVNRLETKLD